MQITGLSRSRARDMMRRISRVIPLAQDDERIWRVLEGAEMNKLNKQVNDAIRRAAGKLPASQAETQTTQQGHGSADGGAGQGQTPRPTTADFMNRIIRDAAHKP